MHLNHSININSKHSTHHLHDEEVDYIVEYDDMDQAKLNMGYRFPTQYGQSGYAAFVVFNMMFGGDPSSVLFNEVREKAKFSVLYTFTN